LYETKIGRRRVEIKVNDTYVNGWVPESSINLLKTMSIGTLIKDFYESLGNINIKIELQFE